MSLQRFGAAVGRVLQPVPPRLHANSGHDAARVSCTAALCPHAPSVLETINAPGMSCTPPAVGCALRIYICAASPYWRGQRAQVSVRTRRNHERDWPASGDRYWPYSQTTVDSGVRHALLASASLNMDACMLQPEIPDVVSMRCRWRGRHCIPAPDEHACDACALSHPSWPGRPKFPPLPPSSFSAVLCYPATHTPTDRICSAALPALAQLHACRHWARALRDFRASALTSAAACVLAGMSMALHADQFLPGHRSRVSRASTTASTRGRCAGLTITIYLCLPFMSTSSSSSLCPRRGSNVTTVPHVYQNMQCMWEMMSNEHFAVLISLARLGAVVTGRAAPWHMPIEPFC